MSKTFALQHPSEPSHDLHSLGTIAAELVACPHPEENRVRGSETGGADPIWCAACGALRFGEGPASRWRLAALPSLLTKKHFDELALLLHIVRQLTLLVRTEVSAPPAREHTVLRTVRASLLAIARLPIVRDLDRLEAVLGEAPMTSGCQKEASR